MEIFTIPFPPHCSLLLEENLIGFCISSRLLCNCRICMCAYKHDREDTHICTIILQIGSYHLSFIQQLHSENFLYLLLQHSTEVFTTSIRFIHVYFMYITVLHECLCTHGCSTHRSQKRVLGLLELE